MARMFVFLTLIQALIAGSACSGISGLDEPAAELSTSERATVREQVDAAVEAKTYRAAWDQEVTAGADRTRLERVALAALENHSRHAPDMFEALREKWGALQPAAREQVSTWTAAAQQREEWGRALELELITADDPPAFTRAFAVYKAAPPLFAPDLLEEIQDARADHEEQAKTKAEGSGG